MRCPECETELPDAAKFCNECGRKLESVCPECGNGNPPASKFCFECGHDLGTPSAAAPLKDLSFDEKLAKIQKYLPSGLTEKVLSQRNKIEGERRQVTIMFVDMKGFTPLTMKLGPEETFSLMDQVFEIMIHKVHDYEGTVNELRGDGILALFGAPLALEDGPQRAIRASLAMHREMVKFGEKIKAEKGLAPIKVRIGINTGPVVVGTLGNDLRVQFTVVGDTINMASRMEQIAEPGTTYVTEDTFKITEGFFRFEALGEKEVKGKDKPLKVYRVIAPSSRRTRFDVNAERGLTRLVGRERELEIMFDAFERAKAGRGQAVSIVGEAGVGKSRLLYEFRKAIANEDVTFLEGKCLSYGRGVAYHPMIDVLKSNFAIKERDGDSEIRAKVKRGLGVIRMDEDFTLPYFLELMSVKDSGIDKIQMSPEGKKDRIVGVLTRIVLKGSEIRPLIIALEDLHWMDQSSEDVSKSLLESIPGARVLLIFTYRPEFVHTWGGKSFHSQINLNRLSNRESLAMVTHLLGSDDIDHELEDFLLQKTEGVPFFIEEFVRSLRDMEIIKRTNDKYHLATGMDQVGIPSTIQDVIMARVDSLSDAPKEVLQAGSAIEREFSYKLIRVLAGLPEQELLSRLSVLKDAELLYERGIYPESAYIFKHALTREVVYESILIKRRELLHVQIGRALEEFYRENIDEQYGLLVEHFRLGGDHEKAALYCKLAAKKAAKTGSLHDAIAYATKGIESLETLPSSERVSKDRVRVRTRLGMYCLQMNRQISGKKAVEPIISLANEHGLNRELSHINLILGGHALFVEENPSKAIESFAKVLELSEALQDPVTRVFANIWMGNAHAFHCRFEKALHHYEDALAVSTATNNLFGMSTLKGLISFWVHNFSGKVHLQYETSENALKTAGESGDTFSRAEACVCHGCSLYSKGHMEEAQRMLLEGVQLCRRIDNGAWNSVAQNWIGQVDLVVGEFQLAAYNFDKAALMITKEFVCLSWVNVTKMGAALGNVLSGRKHLALEPLRRYCTDNKAGIYEGWIRRYLGEILMNIDDHHMSEAQHWIEEAIEADQRNGMRFHLGRDYALYAELFKRKGDRVGAKEQLGKAIEIYKECGADGWVRKGEGELARLQ